MELAELNLTQNCNSMRSGSPLLEEQKTPLEIIHFSTTSMRSIIRQIVNVATSVTLDHSGGEEKIWDKLDQLGLQWDNPLMLIEWSFTRDLMLVVVIRLSLPLLIEPAKFLCRIDKLLRLLHSPSLY